MNELNLTPNKSYLSLSIASPSTPSTPASTDIQNINIIQKFLTDMEEIVKNLTEQQAANPCLVYSDDCIDLQKFCFKLEFLLQYKLKEKKSLFESKLTVNNQSVGAYASKDYWVFFVEVFKSSRGFQDAIKYVKCLNELKTNLGRGRAFIRFCLQYHRLADAIQQLVMDEKIVNNWYKEKAVWYEQEQKNRIFQLLYDLNDVNFELLSGSNFELDTTWPTINMNNLSNPRIQITRHRTNSVTSFTSYYHEKSSDPNSLFSSTPLEMDNEFLISKMNQSEFNQDDNRSIDVHSTFHLEMEQKESKINELTAKLELKDNQLNTVIGELKKKSNLESSVLENVSKNDVDSSDSTMFLEKMASQISALNDQLTTKVCQNNELNECLVKQTNMCDMLSDMLKKTQDKLAVYEIEKIENSNAFDKLQSEFNILSKDYQLKVQQQEKSNREIVDLKGELAALKIIREDDAQKIFLKEEANRLSEDQIKKITQALEMERHKILELENDLALLRNNFQNLSDQSKNKIDQLEDDNNEIKKRLVKLIKEKAELWQKADNLEYENLCKVNAMWVDDANVTSCYTCNSTFSLILRKHHCRICLKIFCYYCCNNWIDYNNSKLRCCNRCHDMKTSYGQLNEKIEKISTKCEDNKHVGIHTITSSDLNTSGNEADHMDESDPDINFEVRPEQLHLSQDEQNQQSIYKTNRVDIFKEENKTISDNPFENAEPKNPFEEIISTNPFEEDEKNEAKIKEALESYQNQDITQQKQQQNVEAKTLKFNNEIASIYSDEASDLIIRKKKILKRKKKISESNRSIDDILNTQLQSKTLENDDSFTILTQEEIDRTK